MFEAAHGMVFSVPLPDGTFVSGRVLLDVYACLKRRLFPPDSPLTGLGKSYLVEMYRAVSPKPEYVPSKILVPGAFLEPGEIGTGWPVVGKRPVKPHEVCFPESLIGMSPVGDVAFQCGEIRIPIGMKHCDLERIGVLTRRHSSYLWPYTCLRTMGRVNEVPAEYKMATLQGSDLRCSSYRLEVYGHLPIPIDGTYYEKQARLGLHFERLYQ